MDLNIPIWMVRSWTNLSVSSLTIWIFLKVTLDPTIPKPGSLPIQPSPFHHQKVSERPEKWLPRKRESWRPSENAGGVRKEHLTNLTAKFFKKAGAGSSLRIVQYKYVHLEFSLLNDLFIKVKWECLKIVALKSIGFSLESYRNWM